MSSLGSLSLQGWPGEPSGQLKPAAVVLCVYICRCVCMCVCVCVCDWERSTGAQLWSGRKRNISLGARRQGSREAGGTVSNANGPPNSTQKRSPLVQLVKYSTPWWHSKKHTSFRAPETTLLYHEEWALLNNNSQHKNNILYGEDACHGIHAGCCWWLAVMLALSWCTHHS